MQPIELHARSRVRLVYTILLQLLTLGVIALSYYFNPPQNASAWLFYSGLVIAAVLFGFWKINSDSKSYKNTKLSIDSDGIKYQNPSETPTNVDLRWSEVTNLKFAEIFDSNVPNDSLMFQNLGPGTEPGIEVLAKDGRKVAIASNLFGKSSSQLFSILEEAWKGPLTEEREREIGKLARQAPGIKSRYIVIGVVVLALAWIFIIMPLLGWGS